MTLPPRMRMAGIAYREDGLAFAGNRTTSGAVTPPVICLHGIGGDDTSFADQLAGLGDRRVIAWNMPGYGGSATIAKMGFGELAEAVIRFMDGMGIETAHLVGQSIGGMIAQEVALRAADRVTSLGLIATVPSFGGRDDSFKTEFLKARLAPLDAGHSMADMAAEAMAHIVGPRASKPMRQVAIDAMAAIDPACYRQVLGCLVTFNRRADQHLITVPCCLIAGAVDDNAPARAMKKMADGLPHAAFHVIDQAGHLVNGEDAVAVNSILTAFFDEHTA